MTRLLLYITKSRGKDIVHLNENISKIQLLQILNSGIIASTDKIHVADELNNSERIYFWINEENEKLIISSTAEKWETIRLISEVLSILIYEELKGKSKNEY